MEVRRGYKRTEAGVIPEDWESTTLGEIFLFKNGLNKAKQFFGFGTPIVNYMDVYKSPGIYAKDLKGRVCVSKQEITSFDVQKGDVFFTRTSETVNEIGIAAVMLDEPSETVFSGFLLRARPKNAYLDNEFKKYCFSSTPVRRSIITKSTYTTRALTNGRLLSAVAFPRPPHPEQHAITAALSDVDDLLTKLDQLISKKYDMKQAVVQELLSGKKRLPGFYEAWIYRPMSELGIPYGGLTGKTKTDFVNGESPYIPFMNVMSGPVIDISWFEYVKIKPGESQNRAEKGDLFFNGSSETPEEVGMCSVLLEEVPNLHLNSFCFGFRFHRDVVADGLFLAYWFRSRGGREAMMSLAQGATRYNLSKSAFQQLQVPQPDIKEQIAIVKILFDMDAEIATLEAQRDKTLALKQGMMQELLTGRIRLA